MNRSAAIALVTSTLLASPMVAASQERRKVQVGFNPGESLAEGLYAQEGGFFSKAGVDAQLVELTNGGAMTAAIVSGAIDIAPSNIASISAAYIRGLHLNLFAPSVLISASAPPTTIIAVPKDSPLRTAKDFNGKTFACSTVRDLQQAAVMTWMDKNGGDSKTATFVEVPNPDQLPALAAKRVDAACLVEPFLSQGKADTRFVARPYDSLGKTLMTFGWIANKDWYQGNPDLVRRVVAALREAAHWANTHHPATAAINSKYSHIPVEGIMATNRQLFSDGKLDPALIQPIVDASAHYGFLPHGFAANELFAPNAV